MPESSLAPWEEFLCPAAHLLCPSDLPGESFEDLFMSGAGGWNKGEGSDITAPFWGCCLGLEVNDPRLTAAGRGRGREATSSA